MDYNVDDIIIDQDERIGVITNIYDWDNPPVIWARPITHPYKTMHDIPNMGKQITITATNWTLQPDGTLKGAWFDRPFSPTLVYKSAHKLTPDDLKLIRVNAGLTQLQLANLFELSSQNYVSKIETGKYNPSKQTLILYQILADKNKDAKRRLTT